MLSTVKRRGDGHVDEGDLLGQLRIGHAQREAAASDRRRRWWLWAGAALLLLLGLATAGLWWLQRPHVVRTAVAVTPRAGSPAAAVLQATGYVTARRQATVSAQITGTLTAVLIEEGDHVRKGQVLARLEDKAQRAQLAAARADVAAAQAQALQIRAQLAQARRDRQRQQRLVARGLVTRQAAEQAATQVDTLAAQLLAQRKQVQAAQAQAQVAKVDFDYTVVRAPFAGVVTEKAAQVGEIVSPLSAGGGFTRTGIGTIVDMSSLEVDVDVNEAYIGRVTPHMAAAAVLDAYPDWSLPAHVIAIVPAADRGKATVKVRVALERKDPRIVPDMGVRVSFLERRSRGRTRSAAGGVMVPASAIHGQGVHAYVFVVDRGIAHRRPVRVAARAYGEMRRVTSGLAAGQVVVSAAVHGLGDGDAVVAAPHAR